MSDLMKQRDIARRLEQTQVAERAFSGYGTVFPASPATGRTFFRTDLGFLCYYDGTRWLTVHETAHPIIVSDAANPVTYAGAGNTLIHRSPYRSDYALYVTRVSTVTLVATTNNATNFWTYTLRVLLADGTNALNVHTFDTSGDAAGVQSSHDTAASVSPPSFASRNYFDVIVTKTLAPGTLTLWSTVYYRLVIT